MKKKFNLLLKFIFKKLKKKWSPQCVQKKIVLCCVSKIVKKSEENKICSTFLNCYY
jgi:hypothetical protein